MKKENEKTDIIDTVLYAIVFCFFLFVAIANIVYIFVGIGKNFEFFSKLFLIILIVALILILICRKELADYFQKEKEATAAKEKCKKSPKDNTTKDILKEITFAAKPDFLTDSQRKKLCDFKSNVFNLVKDYPISALAFPDLTEEELYTLIFINKSTITVIGKTFNNETIDLYVEFAAGNALLKNESVLNNYKKEKPIYHEIPSTHKTSSKAKKLRKQRKNAKNKKDGIVIINGKKYQAPNYDFIAKEWINLNMGYLNKLVMDAVSKGEKRIEIMIPENKLPDRNCWSYIGKRLKTDDEIDKYSVLKDGLKLVVNIE